MKARISRNNLARDKKHRKKTVVRLQYGSPLHGERTPASTLDFCFKLESTPTRLWSHKGKTLRKERPVHTKIIATGEMEINKEPMGSPSNPRFHFEKKNLIQNAGK
jgi:hypothetical protein